MGVTWISLQLKDVDSDLQSEVKIWSISDGFSFTITFLTSFTKFIISL